MNPTSFYIERLKISNFLSFFGCQEVSVDRFTAIICNYYEGSNDLIRALEFVFGANPREIHAESAKYLVNTVVKEDFENEKEVPCFVEFSLNLMSEKKSVKFYRGVKYSGIEHKIDDRLVSYLHYEERLNTFNISIKQKNTIFRKHMFYGVIWGNPEDLEKTITEILRESTSLDEWKKAKERMRCLMETKKSLTSKFYRNMMNYHETVEEFAGALSAFIMKKDYLEESLKLEQILEESTLSSSSDSKSNTPHETTYEILQNDIITFEKERQFLFERYTSLERKEKLLFCQLFFHEVKISSKPANASILQERITKLKGKLRENENYLSWLWRKMEEMDEELLELGRRISTELGHLFDLEESFYLRNKFTTYGRFIDYLKPNKFVLKALRKILGDEIVYGNLCDDVETAILCMASMKGIKYRRRESFIVFREYSPKLKDLLLGSGEEGILINNIQEFQIFLCKLKQYGLIPEVPVILGKRFQFKLEEGKNYPDDIMYPLDGVFLTRDGLIIYASDDTANIEPEGSLLERVNELLMDQEVKYEEYRDFIFDRLETLHNITDLENDITYLKFELRKNKQSRFVELEKRQVSNVYEGYMTLFKEHDQQIEELDRELEESEEYLSITEGQKRTTFLDDRENSQLESLLAAVSADFEETQNERIKAKKELSRIEKKIWLTNLAVDAVPVRSIGRLPIFNQPKPKTQFYYENVLEKLNMLMTENEVEEFESWKDWRKEVIEGFIHDMKVTDGSLKASKAALERLKTTRKTILTPFLEHCSFHLSSTLNFMMDTSLPFLQLTMNSTEDGLQLLTSRPENLVNITDIGSLNTFLKLIAALSLFLEMTVYAKIPVVIFDDIEEFLPRHVDDFGLILDENTLERVVSYQGNVRYQVLMRMAQFFELFIKKNTSGNNIRQNGNKSGANGPVQIIYFTSGDLLHFAKHQLWIQNKILPDEFITKDCNSYSCIKEIPYKLRIDM